MEEFLKIAIIKRILLSTHTNQAIFGVADGSQIPFFNKTPQKKVCSFRVSPHL
jgi:hypothetical protein